MIEMREAKRVLMNYDWTSNNVHYLSIIAVYNKVSIFNSGTVSYQNEVVMPLLSVSTTRHVPDDDDFPNSALAETTEFNAEAQIEQFKLVFNNYSQNIYCGLFAKLRMTVV